MKMKILLSLFTYTLMAFAINVKAQGGTLPLNNSVNGILTSSTPDVWNVTTTADGLLRISLTAVSPADLIVTLYDNNGTTVLGGPVESFNNSTAIISRDGLLPGIYHVKITPFSTAFGSYTLKDSLFTTVLANDAEPNSTTATALSLPLNGSKTGHVGYYYNNQRDTADWYKVTTTADGLLRVYLSTVRGSVNSNNSLDVNVWLYDNNGTTQLANVEVFNGNGPAANMITTDGLAPGTYYIKVQNFSTTEFANYTISDSLFTPPLANDAEPNSTVGTAVALPLNGSKTGHAGYYYNNQRDTADWYKVTTTADGLLRVYLTSARGSAYSGNTLDVNVWLYDNNGTTQLGNVEVYNGNGPATNKITTDGLAPGTYYIKVQNFSTTEFANYTISDSLFTSALVNDAEPNSTKLTATTLPLNGSKTGHVGYYYNNQRDTADWYKVTTTADGLLRVYLTTARSSVYSGNTLDVNVWLYDNNGIIQLGSREVYNGNGPGTNMLTTDGLAAGTYYIKVQDFSTTEFADYTISDSLFIPLLTNDAEPNNSSATAHVFPLNRNAKGHSGYYYNNQRDTTDWYKITTTAAGPLHLYLNTQRTSIYSNNTLDMVITFYKSDGTTQLGNKEVYNSNGPATDSLNFAMLAAGTYFVKVTNFSTAEFASYSLINSVTAGATGLPNIDGSDWTIFGNPVTSNSSVQVQLSRTANVAIQVISMDGKIIKTISKGTIPEGSYNIPLNLGNLPSGIYIVNLITDKQISSKKIVK
jgi:Secretion system C-terminal sorting domain